MGPISPKSHCWTEKTKNKKIINLQELKVKIEQKKLIEVEAIPLGPPPEEYSYRCSHCHCELKVNEAIIDVEMGIAEFEGRYYEGFSRF